ncbi:hypothetical protein FACS1894103_1010 [Campylobacterota bacterium]|nr:hypothetical protein FACS1894103_1010 [Campylobacterota bacterium]
MQPASIKKCLYLDADMLCVGSLRELWDTDIENYAMAAALDKESNFNCRRLGYDIIKSLACRGNYFNAGLLLMNLDEWRKHNYADQIIEWARSRPKRTRIPDQDGINLCLRGKILKVHTKYNIMCKKGSKGAGKIDNINAVFERSFFKAMKEALEDPRIFHVGEGEKPWIEGADGTITRLWRFAKEQSLYKDSPLFMSNKTFSKFIKKRLLSAFKKFFNIGEKVNKIILTLSKTRTTLTLDTQKLYEIFR